MWSFMDTNSSHLFNERKLNNRLTEEESAKQKGDEQPLK